MSEQENSFQENSSSEPTFASTLSPVGLFYLFCKPYKFFSNTASLDHLPELILVVWVLGLTGAMDRIDRAIMQSKLGSASSGWRDFSPWLLSSWAHYWTVVVMGGTIGCALAWMIGGWWYKTRIRWSGANDVDSSLARRVYVYQAFVVSAPMMLITLLQTVLFSNYDEAWESQDTWTKCIVIFLFWSCWTSYMGVVTVFPVKKWKAGIWFLAIPVVLYMGTVGFLRSLYTSNGGGHF